MPFDALTTGLVPDTANPNPSQERLDTIQRPQRPGLTLTDIAKQAGIDRATLCALMVHHGYLELACDSAWKKDPLRGVIGVQTGPL
jgi:hypothetical protein